MSENSNQKFSWTDGFWFFFKVDGHQVTMRGSAWSGKERIWVDDEIVSEKRSFRMNSTHEFVIDGTAYQCNFITTSLMSGTVQCELSNDKGFKKVLELSASTGTANTNTTGIWKSLWQTWWQGLIFGAGAGFGFGFVSHFFGLDIF